MKREYMHGCGNTFFVADAVGVRLSDPEMEHAYHALNGEMSVDGVLFLTASRDGSGLRMNYFDVDSTTGKLHRASMCGNGIRCISRFAVDRGYAKERFSVETDDGYKCVSVDGRLVTVNMGIPRNYQALSGTDYFVDVGLPHYVRFTDFLDVDQTRQDGLELRNDFELLDRLGNPKDILHYNSVHLDGSDEISILTREGGVEDVTQACGTGSAASAYVSHVARGLRLPIMVHNPGGNLAINLTAEGKILMTGPAEYL